MVHVYRIDVGDSQNHMRYIYATVSGLLEYVKVKISYYVTVHSNQQYYHQTTLQMGQRLGLLGAH